MNQGTANGTVISNTASISGTSATSTDTTTVQSSSTNSVRLDVSDSPEPVDACGTLTYTIRVINDQSSSQTVNVTETLDADLQFLSGSDGATQSSRVITWNNLTIDAYATRTLTVTARVDCNVSDGDTLRSTVYSGNATDEETTRVRNSDNQDREQCRDGLDNDNDGRTDYPSDPGCTSSTDDNETDTNNGTALVSVQKYSDRTEAHPGEQISYTVTVRNVSGVTASTITVEDTYPSSQMTIADPGSGILSGTSIIWTIASLAPNEVRTFTYRANLSQNLSQGTQVQNSVRVTGGNLGSGGNAASTVQIILTTPLPRTGAGDFTGPLENTRRFLSPISGAQAGGIPAVVWSSVLLMGAAVGGRFGRRFFF